MKTLFATILLSVTALQATSASAQFREQEAWNFRTPGQTGAAVLIEQTRQLYRGGYYDGSHAARYINIGEVHVGNVDGNIQYQNQSITNIGNYQSNTVQGDSNSLTVDSGQSSADQFGQNGASAQGAGDIGGDYNGEQGAVDSSWIANANR